MILLELRSILFFIMTRRCRECSRLRMCWKVHWLVYIVGLTMSRSLEMIRTMILWLLYVWLISGLMVILL